VRKFQISRNPRSVVAAVTAALILSVAADVSHAQARGKAGPTWTADGALVLPTGFRENWVFLGSPLTPNGLNGGKAAFEEFHNVYIHPDHLRAYRATGEWPEGTIMLKELQRVSRGAGANADGSTTEASGRGFFPAELNGIDISVKDSRRFADSDGWGFFNFGHHAPPYAGTARVERKENCAACHQAQANKMVFDKFYLPILRAK
jgi:Cytochrome P460